MSNVYLICGSPGTGKTTCANKLKSTLENKGREVIHIDGDHIRECWDSLRYSKGNRIQNGKRILNITKALYQTTDAEIVVSFVCPYAIIRDAFHSYFGSALTEVRLTEIHRNRPEDYYVDFEESNFYAPTIKNIHQFENFLKKLKKG